MKRFRYLVLGAAIALLLTGVVLLVMRLDFLSLIAGLALGNAAGTSVILGALAALLAAVVIWKERAAARSTVTNLALPTIVAAAVLVAIAWRRQNAGLETEQVRFVSDGDTLVGTLIRPLSAEPLPGVVIAQGSLNLPHRAYAPLAAALARQGFVVLNYDRRGIGTSAGGAKLDQRNNAGEKYLRQLGRDLAAASRALRERTDVDRTRIGFYGISQGGWIIPIAAQIDTQAAFALIVSGPATSVHEERVFSDLTGEDDDHFARRPPLIPLSAANAQLDTVASQGFDPRPILGSLAIPMRWMMGEWDNSVPVAKTLRVVDSLAATGKPYRAMAFPQANHGLMIARGDRARVMPYWERAVWDTTVVWLRALSGR
jgi:uncharacterized protein